MDTPFTPSEQTQHTEKEPMRRENGVLVIHATQMAQAAAQNSVELDGFIVKIGEAVPNATAVVIDGRGPRRIDGRTSYFFRCLLLKILTKLLDATITLGSIRYRMHNGYATQSGIETGGYYSAFVNVSPKTIHGQNKGTRLPIVFVIDENTPEVTDILSGLQAAQRAFIMQAGETHDAGGGTFPLELPDKVKVLIRSTNICPAARWVFIPTFVPDNPNEDSAIREGQAALQNRISQTRHIPPSTSPQLANTISPTRK